MQKETMKNRNTTEKILQKHGAKAGFSLLELLLCIMIIGLMSVMLVTGVQLALEAYTRVVDQANARVVLSTTMTMLRTELSDARDVTVETPAETTAGEQKLEYQNRITGVRCEMYVRQENEKTFDLVLKKGESTEPERYISETASTKNLHVTYDSIDYTPGSDTLTFINLSVTKDGKPLVQSDCVVELAQ